VLSRAFDGWSEADRDTLRALVHRLLVTLARHADQQDQQSGSPTGAAADRQGEQGQRR
jgi:hypothetical protein